MSLVIALLGALRASLRTRTDLALEGSRHSPLRLQRRVTSKKVHHRRCRSGNSSVDQTLDRVLANHRQPSPSAWSVWITDSAGPRRLFSNERSRRLRRCQCFEPVEPAACNSLNSLTPSSTVLTRIIPLTTASIVGTPPQ